MKRVLIFLILICFYLFGDAGADVLKPGLVLRPIIIDGMSEYDKRLFETVIHKELQKKFTVFSGGKLKTRSDKINETEPQTGELFIKKIAGSFNARFFGVVEVKKNDDDSYRFGLSLYSVSNDGDGFSETTSCKECDIADALEKMKTLGEMISINTSGDGIIRKKVREKYGEHFLEIAIGYLPLTFNDVDVDFMLAGIKYSFAKKDFGTVYIELQQGVSSDKFFYGDQSELVEIDGGDADVYRIGCNYLLISNFKGLSLGVGGGYEILSIVFNSNSESCKVSKTNPYIETGFGYSGEKTCMSLNARYILIDDEPEYNYSLNATYGIHF